MRKDSGRFRNENEKNTIKLQCSENTKREKRLVFCNLGGQVEMSNIRRRDPLVILIFITSKRHVCKKDHCVSSEIGQKTLPLYG